MGALSGRLLLVEDNPINQKVAQSLIKMLGLDCDTADNGEIAIQKLHANAYDVVLMDCQMPVKDGYSATREWRAHEQKSGASPVADHRDDRQRDGRRPAEVPRRGHGRLPVQAGRPTPAGELPGHLADAFPAPHGRRAGRAHRTVCRQREGCRAGTAR
jgi:CheY-like chemotaxis protein